MLWKLLMRGCGLARASDTWFNGRPVHEGGWLLLSLMIHRMLFTNLYFAHSSLLNAVIVIVC
jgi:hypothetical protein